MEKTLYITDLDGTLLRSDKTLSDLPSGKSIPAFGGACCFPPRLRAELDGDFHGTGG